MDEIGRELCCSRSTVQKYLQVFNVPTRQIGTNQKRKRGVAYGNKSIKREIVTHKKELENINRMKELRESGMSYQKIADIFNIMMIPTKTKKGKWCARTICGVLKK